MTRSASSRTVTVAATDEAAVPEQPFAPFEILDKKLTVEPSPNGESKTFTFELQLLCFDVGVHELGPVRVRITSAAGELIEVESNTASIEVHSLLANEPDPQLKQPTDPVIVEQDDYRLLIVPRRLCSLSHSARCWHGFSCVGGRDAIGRSPRRLRPLPRGKPPLPNFMSSSEAGARQLPKAARSSGSTRSAIRFEPTLGAASASMASRARRTRSQTSCAGQNRSPSRRKTRLDSSGDAI